MTFIFIPVLILFQDVIPHVLSPYSEEGKAIIIFAHDNRSELYNKSISMLVHDPLGIDTRNIRIFEIFSEGGIGPAGESYSSEEVLSIRQFFGIKPSDFRILLSESHFEVIYRADQPLKIEEIFQKFDHPE